jgi:hypothetical protein
MGELTLARHFNDTLIKRRFVKENEVWLAEIKET